MGVEKAGTLDGAFRAAMTIFAAKLTVALTAWWLIGLGV